MEAIITPSNDESIRLQWQSFHIHSVDAGARERHVPGHREHLHDLIRPVGNAGKVNIAAVEQTAASRRGQDART